MGKLGNLRGSPSGKRRKRAATLDGKRRLGKIDRPDCGRPAPVQDMQQPSSSAPPDSPVAAEHVRDFPPREKTRNRQA